MTIHYDDKGKFFTDYVSKVAVQAFIQTTTNIIQGLIYIRPGERVSDELNRTEQFLAITDAEIYTMRGDPLYTCEFMTLNREMIVWLSPADKLVGTDDASLAAAAADDAPLAVEDDMGEMDDGLGDINMDGGSGDE